MPPIVAYSLKQNWNADTSHVLNKILTADLNSRLDILSKTPDEIRKTNSEKWQTGFTLADSVVFQQWPPEGTTWTEGWLESTWHQKSPFNNFCPLDPSNEVRTPVGCVATAMVQVLNYHQYIGELLLGPEDPYETRRWGIKIDADSLLRDFPSYSQMNTYLSLIKSKYQDNTPLDYSDYASLSFAGGILLQMDYSFEASSADVRDIASILKDKMSYQTAEHNEDFYSILIENMMNGLPAVLTIKGHAIVSDGYNTDGFFHLNFGWGSN